MSILETEAIVLRGWDFNEYDQIVVCYTHDYGKMSLIAKGVKKPKSRLRSCFEPLTYINLSFLQKMNPSLQRVITADIIDPFLRLKDNLNALMSSFYLVDLVNEATKEHDKNIAIFDLLLYTLRLINAGVCLDTLMRMFEIKLVNILGYTPRLDRCLICNCSIEKSQMRFSISKSGLICTHCSEKERDAFFISKGSIKFFKQGLYIRPEKVSRLHITKLLNEELKIIMSNYFSFHLEKEIKSAPFVDCI